jgi:hypothetical protein
MHSVNRFGLDVLFILGISLIPATGCSLGLDQLVRALWPCPCDPNGTAVAGLIEGPNQCDPSCCDPNYTNPTQEPGPGDLPVGYFEFVGPCELTVGWTDPNSLIIQFLTEVGHLPTTSEQPMLPDTMRILALIDENGCIVELLAYDPENNAGVVVPSKQFGPLMVGETLRQASEGNAWVCEAAGPHYTDPSEVLGCVDSFRFVVYHGDLNEGRQVVVELVREITIFQEIWANAETGRPVIPIGTTVSLVHSETRTLVRSESPFVVFPDLELLVPGSDEGGAPEE